MDSATRFHRRPARSTALPSAGTCHAHLIGRPGRLICGQSSTEFLSWEGLSCVDFVLSQQS
jgi:hypothetical protein